MMELKLERRVFTVTEKDRILDNGSCYQLITQEYGHGFDRRTPKVGRSIFSKLLKTGKIRLSKEKYRTTYGDEMDLYEFIK